MNSFRAVKMAVEFEIRRQTQMLESGGKVLQETRLWNEDKAMTFVMRSKEEAHDYRYFPEPDLVPFTIDALYIDEICKTLPELPEEKFNRLIREYKISDYDAGVLVQDPQWVLFFEACAKHYGDVKKICNWSSGPLLSEINQRKIPLLELSLTPEKLIGLMNRVDDATISNLVAKDVLAQMIETGKTADAIIEEKGLAQVSDACALEPIVDQVIAENPQTIEQIKAGKASAAGFLVGQAMKKSQGKGNPKLLNELIKRRLSL
jgi:aspartyl-tRNA(Asn)/glutamyl-tRNA(Gln) amidotransferase subunit B